MSVFTSENQRVLPVPGAEAQSVTIRQLAPKWLNEASKAAARKAREELNELSGAMGGAMKDMIAAVIEQRKSDAPVTDSAAAPVPDVVTDPLDGFDPMVLLTHGVVSWTLGRPVTPDAFEDLNEDTQTWLAREVLRLSKPALFLSAEERADARKNG